MTLGLPTQYIRHRSLVFLSQMHDYCHSFCLGTSSTYQMRPVYNVYYNIYNTYIYIYIYARVRVCVAYTYLIIHLGNDIFSYFCCARRLRNIKKILISCHNSTPHIIRPPGRTLKTNVDILTGYTLL